MDERTAIITKVSEYKRAISQTFPLPIEKVYLFGSYAKGTQREHSDIDVAVVVEHFDGDFFQVVSPLWRQTLEVDARIEPVVVARDTDYAGFLDEIRNTGIEIE
jgi:predicted nucleotidyltransferase